MKKPASRVFTPNPGLTLPRRWAILLALAIGGCNGAPTDDSAVGTTTSAVYTGTGEVQKLIIRTPKPYDELVGRIEAMGGRVSHRYRYVNAIAAEIPDQQMPEIRGRVGVNAITKDIQHEVPTAARDRFGEPAKVSVQSEGASQIDAMTLARLNAQPDAYLLNTLGLMNMAPLFQLGFLGQGVKVAVIDSGIRPGFFHLESDGSVIGAENVSGDGVPAIDSSNGGHGTFVSGMISANAIFGFASTSEFAQTVTSHCPTCVIELDPNGDGVPDTTLVPMLGSAPSSSIYMVKIFPAGGGGAPESIIIAAMERVLQLKENYLLGMPETQKPDGSFDSLNISVLNMSVGGRTLFAGRDLVDALTLLFSGFDIAYAKSAGNAGPSGTTGSHPGTGIGGLTVGAASVAMNEQIGMDLEFGLGFGDQWRPTRHTQTAYFSARGPTSDGRPDPELVSSGDWNYGMGFSATTSIDLVSGTSLSSASVAGAAAVMRQVVPTASARAIEAALVQAADPTVIADGSGELDQGAGYANGFQSALLLLSGQVDLSVDPLHPRGTVRRNVDDWVDVVRAKKATRNARQLLPGQRREVYFEVPKNTDRVIVTLDRVLPGPVVNETFGDDILLAIHSAKTHAGGYLEFTPSLGGTFVIDDPETGLMRVTLLGDPTNLSPIDGRVTIERSSDRPPKRTANGLISEGEQLPVDVTVPEGVSFLDVELRWRQDWGRYPTSDIDVIAFAPDGEIFFDGATLDSPERFTVTRPAPGPWTFLIDGFTVFTDDDRWQLSVTADDRRLMQD